jgi:hypothetical protein
VTTLQDVQEALSRYVAWANEKAGSLPPLRRWRCIVHVHLTDWHDVLAVIVENGQIAVGSPDERVKPDLVVELSSSELLDVLSGRVNPVERSLEGAIKARGAVRHIVRLDALVTRLYLTD